MYFWRDNHKKEIDLIIDYGTDKFGIEIKRSETIQEKYFSGLTYWMNLSETKSENMFLIYGGEDSYVRNNININGWNRIFNGIIQRAI